MEIVGRIAKDAFVNQLKDERKVVNFSIAVNDYYIPINFVMAVIWFLRQDNLLLTSHLLTYTKIFFK